MMRRIILNLCALLVAGVLGQPLLAADYAEGLRAFQRNDFATALRIWRPLAERGDDSAQHGLGMAYQHGMGVAADSSLAVKWFQLAANSGNEGAQYSLGFMYSQGRGVARNYPLALK